MKNSVKSLAVTGIAVLGFLPFATPARAGWGYKDYEHPVVYFSGNPSQSSANQACQNYIYQQIDWSGGTFTDLEHRYRMTFAKFARPYVWAHLQNRHCVINASWGYVRW